MTVRFKKVRNFDTLKLHQEFEQDMLKEDLDDIYEIDNREVDVDPEDIATYGLVSGYLSA